MLGAFGFQDCRSTAGLQWSNVAGLGSTAWGSGGALQTVMSIAWNGSVFCAVGEGAKCATSTDGVSWTYSSSLNTAWGSVTAYSVVWAGTKFVAVGASGKCATSTDGVTWTNQTGISSTGNGTANVYAIAWDGSSKLVTVGANGRVCQSTDGGITWAYNTNLATQWSNADGWGICWAGTYWCAIGANGKFATSSGASSWTNQTGLSATSWGTSIGNTVATNGLTQFNGLMVVAGGNNCIATSPDGYTWTYSLTTAGGITSIVWTGTNFVACGTGRVLYTSPDGVTWTQNSQFNQWPAGTTAESLVWNGTTLVCGGAGGNVAVSVN